MVQAGFCRAASSPSLPRLSSGGNAVPILPGAGARQALRGGGRLLHSATAVRRWRTEASGAGHDAAAVVQATAQGIVAMAKLGWWGTFWLNRFSQPAGDRSIYRQVQATIPRRVLEIGLGTLGRAERLLSLLQTIGPEAGVQYVGLDRIEGRLPGDPPGVTLKQAHQRLRPLARVQLWPGSADTSLSRLCNHLGLFDLVLVSADNEPQHLERSWFFIQRVVNAQTTILVETAAKTRGGATLWQVLEKSQLDALAARTLQRRAA